MRHITIMTVKVIIRLVLAMLMLPARFVELFDSAKRRLLPGSSTARAPKRVKSSSADPMAEAGAGTGTGAERGDKELSASPRRNIVVSVVRGVAGYGVEMTKHRVRVQRVVQSIKQALKKQRVDSFDKGKDTVFVTITCGQAIRNFLLSDFYELMRQKYNLVILSPYAYAPEFVAAYRRPGVHVLPWFSNYRPWFERVVLFYLMKRSGSGTHQGWLSNLEERSKGSDEERFVLHRRMRRVSNALGAVFGRRGLCALYQCYMVALLPKGLLHQLFERYRPALVISTAAHHPETWALTYYARKYGAKTMCNVLSWDNTTTKPVMDPACDVCTVWSEEMADEVARHFSYLNIQTRVTGSPLFDMYRNKRLATDRGAFLTSLGLSPDLPYVLYTTNTPAATTDEHIIVQQYWDALCRSPLGGKISLVVRLHPKQKEGPFEALGGLKDVAVTLAGPALWTKADRWIPGEEEMRLLLNSMMHAAVSVNIASTMSLESFALDLPTINVALRSSEDVRNPTLMWSFDMFHTSDHYRAIVDNGAVDLARSIDEMVALTINAVEHGNGRKEAMRKTLRQKAAYSDGTSAQRFADLVDSLLQPGKQIEAVTAEAPAKARRPLVPALPHAAAAE